MFKSALLVFVGLSPGPRCAARPKSMGYQLIFGVMHSDTGTPAARRGHLAGQFHVHGMGLDAGGMTVSLYHDATP